MENINIGMFTAIWDSESKQWVYKANNNKALKKDGTLKAQYKDRPRYPVIYRYEGSAKKQFDNVIKDSVVQITKQLKQYIK